MTADNSVRADPQVGGNHGTSNSSPSSAQVPNQASPTSTAQPRAITPPATATQRSSAPPAAPPTTTREPVVKTTWDTITSKFSPVTLWIIAFLSLVFAAFALWPALTCDKAAEEALGLAKWTALKDFREQCKELIDAGSTTPECALVTSKPLPSPPYFNLTIFKRAMTAMDWNATMAPIHQLFLASNRWNATMAPIHQLFLASNRWNLTETKGCIALAIFAGQIMAHGIVFSLGTAWMHPVSILVTFMHPVSIFFTLFGVLIGYTIMKGMTYMEMCLGWFLHGAYLIYLLIQIHRRQEE